MTEMYLQSPVYAGGADQEKKIIGAAVLVSILLHVVLVIIFIIAPYDPQPDSLALNPPAQDVELVFESPIEEDQIPDDGSRPSTYVSVPDRHAVEEAPEDPDYLALHHSVAADNQMGTSEDPSADEESPYEMVAIQKEDMTGAGGVEFSQQPLPEKDPATSQLESGAPGSEQAVAEIDADEQKPDGEWALPEDENSSDGDLEGAGEDEETNDSPDLEDWWGGQSNPSILKAGEDGSTGDRGFDFNQQASGAMTSGVAVIDEFQLSTVQWDWAPWIQVFGNELHRHWVSPYAYRLGLINGTTVIRLVVEKDGRPSSMAILDEDGHESLHDASLAALKAFAPYLPLPDHFPEENLVITLSLHYPAFRR